MVLPEHPLPDIRWISGGSCGGKTICSKNISRRLGIKVYHADDNRLTHHEKADVELFPTLSRKIKWPDFFNSEVIEILNFWECLCFERMEMILEDLAEINSTAPVIVEGVYAYPELLKAITPNAPSVFLFAERDFLRSCYYGRESTLWMEAPIATCDDPEKVKLEWMEKWIPIDDDRKKRATSLGFPCLEASSKTDWRVYEAEIERLLMLRPHYTAIV